MDGRRRQSRFTLKAVFCKGHIYQLTLHRPKRVRVLRTQLRQVIELIQTEFVRMQVYPSMKCSHDPSDPSGVVTGDAEQVLPGSCIPIIILEQIKIRETLQRPFCHIQILLILRVEVCVKKNINEPRHAVNKAWIAGVLPVCISENIIKLVPKPISDGNGPVNYFV